MPQGEPLELQLQRERVARTQVEALLESTRLQLIEMEIALRKAREEATLCLSAAAAAPPAPAPPPPAAMKAPPPPKPAPVATVAITASPTPAALPATPTAAPKPVAPKPRPRRAVPKPATSSLQEAARAAEAIEKASRETAAPMAPAGGMVSSRGREPLLSTLDLHEGDNRAIVTDFVQHIQTRLDKLQECYGCGNATELKWHVTWIKDNAAPVGFSPLVEPAANLDQALENDEKERISGLLDALVQLAERVAVESVRR